MFNFLRRLFTKYVHPVEKKIDRFFDKINSRTPHKKVEKQLPQLSDKIQAQLKEMQDNNNKMISEIQQSNEAQIKALTEQLNTLKERLSKKVSEES